MGRKAIGLLSGGLDSRLAVKMMLDQGIEVEALNFVTVFCTCTARSSCRSEARKAAEEFCIPLKVLNATDEIMDAVRNPRHGYGRGLNPCLDCRISMFRRAGAYMQETGADFIFTGEVLGERPMSQRPDAILTIERESGLEGLVVRPLSAHLFEPSIPEREGWVDREAMMAMRGRSRKPQMQLAAELGVGDYPCPAGGCLLTEKGFSRRLKRLLEEDSHPPVAEIRSLRLGRIFLSSCDRRIIIPRNEEETRSLESLARPGDIIMSARGHMGPTTIVKGKDMDDRTVAEAAALTARYGQGRDEKSVVIGYSIVSDSPDGASGDGGSEPQTIEVSPEEGRCLAEQLERL
jgi:tRNA U34 2-thiouridine synthase MnmA/TrmU